jgi:hypothetical protein
MNYSYIFARIGSRRWRGVECLLCLLGSKEVAEVEKQQNVTDSQSHLVRKISILKNRETEDVQLWKMGKKLSCLIFF